MKYEVKKHDGSLPIIGVNTFLPDQKEEEFTIELARSTDAEKQSQIKRLAAFKAKNIDQSGQVLDELKQRINDGGNGFELLMEAVRHCSLGELTNAFFEVGMISVKFFQNFCGAPLSSP